MALLDGLKKFVIKQMTAGELLVQAAIKDKDLSKGLTGYTKPVAKRIIEIDLRKWQSAIALASKTDDPNRLPLYDLYDRVDYDDMVITAAGNRINPVKQSKFRWVNAQGVENEELTKAFQKMWFYDFLQYALESRFWGHSLIEVIEVDETGAIKKVELVNRRHVKPHKRIVTKNQSDTSGQPYDLPPASNYVFEVGRWDYLGIYEKLVPFVAMKSLINSSWGIFTEKYGMPARSVVTRSTDKKRLDQLASMMESFGRDQWAVLQGDEKMELLSLNAQNSSSDNFDKHLAICDRGIERMVLGTNAVINTKDQTGTYGGIKALMEVSEYHLWNDKTFIQNLINEFSDEWQMFGYKTQGFTFEWDEFEEMDTKDMIDAIPKIAPHAELDWEKISEKTGIPILGPKQSSDSDPLGK
jgi:hypothetical protein